MSVSQKPNAPRVPDWEAEEIIEYMRQKYGKPQDLYEELEMNAQEIVNWAYALEPDEGDLDKQVEFLDLVKELEEEYESEHWVNEENEDFKQDSNIKKIYYGVMRDPDNDDCWILITETEFDG